MTTAETQPTEANIPSPPWKASSIIKVLSQIILICIVLYVTFGVIIPSFASYDEIWEAMTSVSAGALVLIILLQLVNMCAQAVVPAMLVEKLKFWWSFISGAASTLVSNLIPGPSGTAMRYMIYRSYDISAVDFGRSTVANSILNNSVLLIMPVLTLILLPATNDVKSSVWWLAGIAATIAILILVFTMFVMRSEKTTRRLAHYTERICNPFLRLIHKQPLKDFGDHLASFRVDSLLILQQEWRRLLLVLVARYILNTVMLFICMNQVGIPTSALSYGAVFAVYAFTRLLTFIEITPGGVGVTEAVYIYLFSIATDGAYDSEIVGGVFLYRAATYLMPILVGAVSLIWWRVTVKKPAKVAAA